MIYNKIIIYTIIRHFLRSKKMRLKNMKIYNGNEFFIQSTS